LLCDLRLVILPVPVILNRFDADLFVRIFGIFLLAGLRLRVEHHDHQAPIQSGNPFDGAVVDTHFREHVQFLASKLRVRHFARLEHAGHLDLVALFEESDRLLDLERKIVFSDPRTDLYTFYFELFALLVLAALTFQVLVPSVVDDSTNGRRSGAVVR